MVNELKHFAIFILMMLFDCIGCKLNLYFNNNCLKLSLASSMLIYNFPAKCNNYERVIVS